MDQTTITTLRLFKETGFVQVSDFSESQQDTVRLLLQKLERQRLITTQKSEENGIEFASLNDYGRKILKELVEKKLL